jgi:hypothetical protein
VKYAVIASSPVSFSELVRGFQADHGPEGVRALGREFEDDFPAHRDGVVETERVDERDDEPGGEVRRQFVLLELPLGVHRRIRPAVPRKA